MPTRISLLLALNRCLDAEPHQSWGGCFIPVGFVMRLFRFSVVVASLFALLGGRAFAEPTVCPIWEIDEWEGMKLYYAEYQVECGEQPESMYVWGNFDWPAACGAGGCVPAEEALVAGSDAKAGTPRVRILAQGWTPKTDQFEMPPGPARRFATQISRMAVRFDHDSNPATAEKTAYCYTYLLNAAALGGDGESKVAQFGFEANAAPAEAPLAKVVRKRNPYTYHVEYEGNVYVVQLR